MRITLNLPLPESEARERCIDEDVCRLVVSSPAAEARAAFATFCRRLATEAPTAVILRPFTAAASIEGIPVVARIGDVALLQPANDLDLARLFSSGAGESVAIFLEGRVAAEAAIEAFNAKQKNWWRLSSAHAEEALIPKSGGIIAFFSPSRSSVEIVGSEARVREAYRVLDSERSL